MPKRRKRENPEHRRVRDSMDYDHLFEEQGGLCGICSRGWAEACPSGRRFHRDHDRVRMLPRGLLCYRCNTALRDYMTLDWCEAAVQYLRRHEP